MLTLERYIFRNHVGPFFFSLSILTFIFIIDFILRYIDPFLKRGISFDVFLQVFLLSLGHMFALIIPMTVLPATIMAFGNLAAENEITAMKANGISLYRMMAPSLIVAAILTAGMIVYNNHLLPESNHKLRNLLMDIYKKKPSIRIRANTFIDEFEGYTIYVREKNDKTGEIRDVQIFENVKGRGLPKTIVAKRGKLVYLEKEHVLRFDLEDGEIHEMPQGNDASMYRRTTFKSYIMNIEDIDRSLKRTERVYRGDREMSAKQMGEKIQKLHGDIGLVDKKMNDMADYQIRETFKLLDPEFRNRYFSNATDSTPASIYRKSSGSKEAIPRTGVEISGGRGDFHVPRNAKKEYITYKALGSQWDIRRSFLRQINRYEVEIEKKYSIPFACIIFVLVGAPLAIRTGRSGMNTAIGLSIGFFLIYYISLIGGEKLADRRIISPFTAMWGANILCGAGGLYLVWRTTKEQSLIRWYKFNPLRIFIRENDSANS